LIGQLPLTAIGSDAAAMLIKTGLGEHAANAGANPWSMNHFLLKNEPRIVNRREHGTQMVVLRSERAKVARFGESASPGQNDIPVPSNGRHMA
jgi:hypothetical protein